MEEEEVLGKGEEAMIEPEGGRHTFFLGEVGGGEKGRAQGFSRMAPFAL